MKKATLCCVGYCRHRRAGAHRKCAMHRKREYRAAHPIRALWHRHRYHAKKRGIPVEWTFAEFEAFCLRTNYHVLVKEGMTIERNRALEGYSATNCSTLTHLDNSTKGARIDKWLWARLGGRPRQAA